MVDGRCRVCGGDAISELLDAKVAHPLWWRDEYPQVTRLRYLMCDNCGYIFLWPRFTLAQYRDIYANTPGLNRDEIFRARQKMLLARKAFIEKTSRATNHDVALEVGTAYGDFLRLFSRYERKIGIEPSVTYVRQAKDEGAPIEYYPYMLESLLDAEPQLAGVADLALACHVLEHALDPVAFVTELTKLLNDGGELFIEVPSIEGMAQIARPRYQNLYFGHVSQFSVPVLTRIAVACGLLPVAVEYHCRDNYPVIQGLFKKAPSPRTIADMFAQHARRARASLDDGRRTFRQLLFTTNLQRLLVWGCGQDLFDLVALFDADCAQLFRQKVTLVDRNEGKHGCEFGGLKIASPDAVSAGEYDCVVIATRSEILNSAIIQDCISHFPGTPIRQIFCNEEKN